MDNDIKLYRVKDLARILGITERTALIYCEKQKIKSVKIGGKWTVSEKNLQAFIGNA
jgi:predicted site-specific integrase-resolvase